MACTNNDLKRLKERLYKRQFSRKEIRMRFEEVCDIPDRLEAAEDSMLTPEQLRKAASWIPNRGNLINFQLLTALHRKVYKVEAWRKATGVKCTKIVK